MDSVRNQREAKGVIMKTKSTKTEVVTSLYRKLHGRAPHGKAPSILGERLWWFCPAWQLQRRRRGLDNIGVAGTFEKAQAIARRHFAERGTKNIAVIPHYWTVVNKGNGCERLYLSPQDFFARLERRKANRK